ncbi:hypothetical protein [Petropleomorpha daqingensis]|uniref:Uncharacterized protein n=1 Tax=Petropleomorpha daqingensis TaxID=2026353 RepID=A0A853CKZ8_9ACTN|nr:hypothetical protein [Petropleomorpha daqingensis]NYJ07529.1 hypothetical protein [Petropleomorpha daqingensis]
MEYTALLAGEPHTDQPACVDAELAAVLRGANDKLGDADRALLVPLLGRSIGLSVGPPPKRRLWARPAAERRQRREEIARYERQAVRLRREVSRRFVLALGRSPASVTDIWSGCGEEVSWVFWDLMDHPARTRTSSAYVRRLVDRLYLLHECYEQAMAHLALESAAATVSSGRPVARRDPLDDDPATRHPADGRLLG